MLGKVGKALMGVAKAVAEFERKGRELEKTVKERQKEQEKRVLKLGVGDRFEVDETELRYFNVYGKEMHVPRKSVQTVTVMPAGWGKGRLQIVGGGTVLAEITLPIDWAKKAQAWILKTLEL